MRTPALCLSAVLLLALAACSKVNPETYAKVEAGMSRDEVYGLLGKPDEVSGGGVGTLTMSSETWKGGQHTVKITFAGDKVALKSIDTAEAK